MSDFKRVEFKTADGVTLRGDFFQASGENRPIVVMTQGLSLLKEHYIQDTARRFQAAGISALTYDHRGFGSSDGLPRHHVDPLQQGEDYHDAVLAAASLPGVDPTRIAVWGIGHSGGAAMIAAGSGNPRIKVAVIHMPYMSGAIDAAKFPAGILDRAWKDRENAVTSEYGAATYVQLWPHSLANATGQDGEQTFLTSEHAWNFYQGALARSNAAGTPWENRITLQSFPAIARAEPKNFLAGIAPRPTLYIAAEEDPITAPLEEHKKVFALAGKNAEFKVIKPDHLGSYFGEPFEAQVAVQIEFLQRVL